MNRIICIAFLCIFCVDAKTDQECSKTICYPTAGDLLIGRDSMLRTSSTCGLENPEEYCVVTLKDRGRDSKCSTCDSRHPYNRFSSSNSHRIGNVVSRLPQDSDRWWQSSNGIHNVSIEVEFVTEFQFIFTQLRFKTYRPAAMYIERSKDYGLTWQKSAYFSDNCAHYFKGVPERKRNSIEEVTCTSEFSSISPSEGGTVLFVATPSDLHTNDENWVEKKNEITAITNLRVQFVKLHTFGDVKIDNNPSILKKYHYAVSEWIIRGRCSCYGHADMCKPKKGELEMKEKVYGVCVCQHNTIGSNCERCKDFYNDTPWLPAENNATNECKKCECNNHSTSCHFNSVIYELSGRKSGGKCDNCTHNTEGIHCESCSSGYYRNPDVNTSSPDTCLKCKCDNDGTNVPGFCNQETEPDLNIVAGSCTCKANVMGYYCDRCKTGFWNFDKNDEKGCRECKCLMNGTANNDGCDTRTGTCVCKKFVEGERCNICKDGYYNIAASNPLGCSPCQCSSLGSLNIGKCDRSSGQCNCKEGFIGTTCEKIKDGWFIISPRYPLRFHNKTIIEIPPVLESGVYNIIVTFDTQQVMVPDVFVVLLTVDHKMKTICAGKEETIYLNEDNKIHIIPNKCLVKNVTIILSFDLVVDPSDGTKVPEVTDVKVIPNLALNSSQTRTALAECIKYPPKSRPPNCSYLNTEHSSGMAAKDEPTKCNCNVTGSVSHICNKNGGQCNCLPNVVGRQCNQCKANSYGFDARGCKECNCEPSGSLNLQCASDTGKCLCRVGVEGRQCNGCKSGFWRFPFCESCICHGMADMCDKSTGECVNCRGNAVGFNCQKCSTGFYGDPRRNIACLKCHCPGLSLNLNHSSGCELIFNTTSYLCICKSGYKGQFCGECDENYFGNPRDRNGRCSPCVCSNNIDRSVPDSCDKRTGECKKCLYNTVGYDCEKCETGYFGNGVSRTCKKCVCNRLGTNTSFADVCNHQTGQCPCLPNVIGKQCDQCKEGFYNLASGIGCLPCDCDSSNGALNETCNHLTGQCHCRESRGGLQCDKCRDGYWGDPRLQDGCKACHCNNEGSIFNQCNRTDGACKCKPGITGRYCDRCSRGTAGVMPNCTPCGDCWTQWDKILDDLYESVNKFQNGSVETVLIPGQTKYIMTILEKIENNLESLPVNFSSLVDKIRVELDKLRNQFQNISFERFNKDDYPGYSQSITNMTEEVENFRITDSGGAYNIIEKAVESIHKSLNETIAMVELLKTIVKRSTQEKVKVDDLNVLKSKTNKLAGFATTLSGNLNKFNELTCNKGSSDISLSCSDPCSGGVGCQPNNCSRTVFINDKCLIDETSKFFNAYASRIEKRNVSIKDVNEIVNDIKKTLKDSITRAQKEISNRKNLLGLTSHSINNNLNRAIKLLERLKVTLNTSVSEFDFIRILEAINNFTLTKHSDEIKKIERDIENRIQMLNDTVNEVMNKSTENRKECDSLKKLAVETKANATNLLSSIKDLEHSNQLALKIQSDTKGLFLSLNIEKDKIKVEQDETRENQDNTETNHKSINTLILVLKSIENANEISWNKIKDDFNMLSKSQEKIRMKLKNLKSRTQTLFEKQNSLSELSDKYVGKNDQQRQELLDKFNKLKQQLEKTRVKIMNARSNVSKKQLDLKTLEQRVEEKLQRISSLEFEMHKKSEYQSSCLP